MMKYRLTNDWLVEDFFDKIKIYDQGHVFEPNEDGKYEIKGSNGSFTMLTSSQMDEARDKDGNPMFERIEELPIESFEIEEAPEEDMVVKKWRIQLDVKTTKKKLENIQKMIQENIQGML
jgi:hypothetical protein